MKIVSQPVSDIFTQKYRLYGDMIFRLSMIYLQNPSDSEDVVQDIFIKLLYKAPNFVDEEHEKRWLIRITINACKDRLKSAWRRKVVKLNEAAHYTKEPLDQILWETVLKLSYKYKAPIHLYYYEGYNVKEISQILSIGISAVKMRLKRGREFLKIELEDEKNER